MNFRLRHSRWLWTVVALAPLLLARALVPSGFMAEVAGGEVRISFCGGIDSLADGKSAAQDPCPFALSAGAAPLPAFEANLAVSHVPEACPSLDGSPTVRQDACPRVQQSRAPPHVLSRAT